jgi:hypothetical protein
MTTYRYCAYVVKQPDKTLLEGTVRARDIMRALDRVIDMAYGLAIAKPEVFWPARPGVGQEQALRPVWVVLDVQPTTGEGAHVVHHLTVRPFMPGCVTVGLQHDLRRYGQRGRCCSRCGIVEQPVEGGYMLYYRPAVEEVAQ